MTDPDLIITGGTVITVDPRDRPAEAVAVTGGRIAAVGGAAEIRSMARPGTRLIELPGGAVLPGINDAHLHAIGLGLARPPLMLDVTYPKARSIAEVVAAVRAEAARVPAGSWIRGTGWDVGFLDECRADPGRLPCRHDLDAATTEHPVVLEERYGHSSWTNTRALRETGIDAGTAAPAGSVIGKDAGTGEPTGLFREFGAMALLQDRMPDVDMETRRRAARGALDILTPLGITSFTDPALGPGGGRQLGGAFHADGIEVYAELAASGGLRARVNVLLLFGAPYGTAGAGDIEAGLRGHRPPRADPAWLRVGGVKIFADGIPPSRTAWMSEPYEGRPGECGSLVVRGDDDEARRAELTRMVGAAHAAGYQVGVHATGDRAAAAVVRAYEEAMRAGGDPDPRHYVIHGDFLTPWTIDTMARLRIGLCPQPAIQWTLSGMLPEVIGRERTAAQWPLRTLLDRGVPVALSSDGPVMDPDWRRGVAAAVLRESKATGEVVGPEHRIGVLEALRAYTLGGARQDHADGWKGSIEVGKVADLCLLGANPLTVDPRDIPDIPVRCTILDGEVIHEDWT